MTFREIHYLRLAPSSIEYRELLQSLLGAGRILAFIAGSDQPVAAARLLDELEPFALGIEKVREWPGTVSGATAPSYRFSFKFSEESLEAWTSSIGSFYGEQDFSLFDLHILRTDGSTLLGSMSSHETAWLQMNNEEFQSWSETAPASAVELFSPLARMPGEVKALPALSGTQIGAAPAASELESIRGNAPLAEIESLCRYLDSGVVVERIPGLVQDVLGSKFAIEDGGDLLTDGEYLWRRDASAYVRHYQVGVPSEFLEKLRQRNWNHRQLSDSELDEISNYIWSGVL